MANNEKIILDTLAYKGVFRSSITFYQLRYFLFKGTKLNLKEFSKLLEKLCESKKISKKNATYYFANIKPFDWKTRAKNSRHIINEHSKTLALLKSIPWIQMIAITGSVAAFNAQENDDLDLLIVTKKDRMWLTRFFVAVFLLISNKYPNPKTTKNKICPNIYLTENNLHWDRKHQNMYTAHEILLLRPYYYKDDLYFKFLLKNDWIENYMQTFPVVKCKLQSTNINQSKLLDFVERVIFKMQKRYMHKKQTTEKVSHNLIHFNKNDSTSWVLDKHNELTKKA